MPFVKRVPPHPQPKYYVEYQAGGFLCYQRVEPATAHNNLLCIINQMCSCTFDLLCIDECYVDFARTKAVKARC